MANEEVLGSRKTMFVLVIVVGCFAVLWPRLLAPLLLGQAARPGPLDRDAAMKQERPPIRGAGPHPALRERGRAIPAGAPTPPSRGPVPMPPHARVRSPLSVYFQTEVDFQPPPIPGMRPPLGSPGGPVPAPKSSMGFVMPIYTICIIVFFVYTLSKILFKRTGSIPYEQVAPDPHFRRRVFRDDSRSSPDTKLVVTAISGLVAEVHQQMEANYAQSQQRQEAQENHSRPYTNGSVLKSSPIIVASELVESKEKSPETEKQNKASLESEKSKEASPEPEKSKEASPEPEKSKEASLEPEKSKEATPEPVQPSYEKSPSPEVSPEEELESSPEKSSPEEELPSEEASPEKSPEESPEKEPVPNNESKRLAPTGSIEDDLLKLTEDIKEKKELLTRSTEEFLNNVRQNEEETAELLKEALKEDEEDEEEEEEEGDEPEQDNVSVKVLGMELSAPAPAPPPPPPAPRAHEADEVKSIFLETRIPQQSHVLVTEFEDKTKPAPRKHDPMVVSGKMTLSLIQDAPRDTPERDLESTVDDFTTASAMTQPAAQKDGESSDEEIEEEIEIEEIEEEEEEENGKLEPKPKQ